MNERQAPRRALIPCGGRGTRMASITHGGTKEMLPVGGVPAVGRVLMECAASGMDDVLVISAPGKAELDRYVTDAAGKRGMPQRIGVEIQREARGLADAIRMGRDFSSGEALGVALPDNLFLAQPPALAQLAAVYVESGKSVVAMVELFSEDADRYGPTAIYPGAVTNDSEFRIDAVPSKGDRKSHFDLKGAASAFTAVGRYVFRGDVFDAIDEIDRGLSPGEELDDIPVMRLLLLREALTGCRVRGDFLDAGIPTGYAEANERLSAASSPKNESLASRA